MCVCVPSPPGKPIRQVPPDAHHHSCIPTPELHLQRLHLHAHHHEWGVQKWCVGQGTSCSVLHVPAVRCSWFSDDCVCFLFVCLFFCQVWLWPMKSFWVKQSGRSSLSLPASSRSTSTYHQAALPGMCLNCSVMWLLRLTNPWVLICFVKCFF